MQRREIFEIIKNHLNDKNEAIYEIIENEISNRLGELFKLPQNVKYKLKTLLSQLRKKWQDAHRMESRFFDNNNDWLNVIVPICKETPKAELPAGENLGTYINNLKLLAHMVAFF